MLRHNFRILKKLWCSDFLTEGVPRKVLAYEGFDFTVFTGLTKNPKTKAQITWVYSLGIEPSKGGELFILHHWAVDGLDA